MSTLSTEVAGLSPAQRALLELRLRQRRGGAAASPVRRVSRETNVFPVSFAQQRLWLFWQMEPESAAYNLPEALRLKGPLDRAALEVALGELVRRHEVLRTTFSEMDGQAVQVVAPAGRLTLGLTDLSGLPEAEREERLRRLAAEEAQRPFDLARGPLMRASLLRLAPEDHVVLLTLHHIIADDSSTEIFIREVSALYEAALKGGPLPLPELPIQYADYAVWQREHLQGERLDAALRYWKGQLAGAPPLLDLPTDRPRPPVRTFRGGVQTLTLPKRLSEELKALSHAEGVTLFMLTLAAFKVLLWRYTGQEEIVVGSPVANRTTTQVEGLIGFFVNNLVLRTGLGGDPTFRELVARVREVTVGAFTHQELPFQVLLGELQPERNLSHAPLYQVVFQFHPARTQGLALPGLSVTSLGKHNGTAQFDLIMKLRDGETGLTAFLEYNTDLFDDATVERQLRHFQTLLEGIVRRPDARISEFELLTLEERRLVLDGWNETRAEFGPEHCIHRLVEAQVERTPEATAVVFEGQRLSYRELNGRANCLARELRARGVGPESRVAVCVERSLEMVVGLLAVFKAGGAYVPLDPQYPSDRLRFMLADARVALLLTQQSLAGLFDSAETQLLCLDEDARAFEDRGDENLDGGATDDNLAYVIYTSGSTGQPKGVMITHRAICNRLLWMQSAFPLAPDDAVLQKTSYSFDASVWELFVPLFAGARLVVAAPGGHQDCAYMIDAVVRERVTTLQLVPSMLEVFLSEPGVERCRGVLRRVYCGGEALGTPAARRCAALLGVELVNLYGPTEASIDASFQPFREEFSQSVVPIGRPVANMRAYVLDAHLRPVPSGVSGGLYVSGVGLARGYLNRPATTAERFIPDPFDDEPGARMYRTGDVARFLPDGTLEYLGREDHQVKVRGFRIELSEIEAVLKQHESVGAAVVQAQAGESGPPRLVAYVVLREEVAGGTPGQTLHRLPNGLEVAHLNPNETETIYREIFEDFTYLRHGVSLEDGDCVFDVGANIGLFSLFVGQVCDNARVFAFEPIPATAAALRANVERHGIDARIFECGLSSERGRADFTFYPRMSAMSGRYADETEDADTARAFMSNQDESLAAYADELLEGRFGRETHACRLRTVSEVIAEHGVERVDLLKVDVEKSELDVLRGVADADWPKLRQVVVEVQDTPRGRLAEIVALLKGRGFDVVVEQDGLLKNTPLHNLYATRPGQTQRGGAQESARHRLARQRPAGGRGRLPAELRRHLAERLPEHMIPAAFVLLDALPLTPNGKLDRRALPAYERPYDEADEAAAAAPRNSVEELLVGIWADLFGLPRVGVHDNFFELGGHSLLAIRLISRVREACRVELQLRHLFESPTVAGLARTVESRLRGAGADELPPVVRVPRDGELPLSFAQQRLWFLQQLEPDGFTYNIPEALRLRGPLDAAALEQTFGEIVRRHEVLRTTFAERGGQPRQLIAPEAGFRLTTVDLSDLPAAERETRARLLADEEARRRFDLERGPVLRATLLQLGTEEHVLLVTLHHIVTDHWAMQILIREVTTLYRAFAAGRPSPLPELPVQYADFAAWQRRTLRGALLEEQLAYWRRQLEGAPASLKLPLDAPRPEVQSFAGACETVRLSPELSEALGALGRREGVTLFMLTLAAFKVLLGHCTGQEDIVVGSPVANRRSAEAEGLIGFFLNNLVLRTRLDGNPTFRELLVRARETALAAYAHQDVPFEKLVEELQATRDAGHTPLFQIMFTFQEALGGDLALDGLRVEPYGSRIDIVRFDLVMNVVKVGERLSASLIYRTDLFKASTVAGLLELFEAVLLRATRNPETRLAEFQEELREAERRRWARAQQGLSEAGLKGLKRLPRRGSAPTNGKEQVSPAAARNAEVVPTGVEVSTQRMVERPRPATVNGGPRGAAVKAGYLHFGSTMPYVVEPAEAGVDLVEWAGQNRAAVEAQLRSHGAILFRNFEHAGADSLARFVENVSAGRLEYRERSSPRSEVSDRIYTSTDYPAEHAIFLHNENSYQHTWPMKLFFYCETAAERGGETPIADCRRILQSIDPAIVRRFVEKRVMYVRNFGDGFGLPWQKVFQTDDRAAVEEYCRRVGLEVTWKERGRLRTQAVRPAVSRHPLTGEPVWFNHATFFHFTTLEPAVRELLLAEFAEEDLPTNSLYGDGTPIEPSVLEELREVYRQETVRFPWQQGDILMLDNMLAAHGRAPFYGARKILVAMAEPMSWSDLEARD